MKMGDARSLHAMLSESISVLAEAVKWEPVASGIIIKTFMEALIRKITHQAKTWRNNPNSPSWDNLAQVITIVKELLFYMQFPHSLITSTMSLATSNASLAKTVINQLHVAGIQSSSSVSSSPGERSNSLKLRRPSFGADRKSSGRTIGAGLSVMFLGSPPRIWKRKVIANVTSLAATTTSSSGTVKRDSKSGSADGNALCLLDSTTLELLTSFLDNMDVS
jgi:hypothetical protein